MPRLSITQLEAQANSTLPDNSIGAITPADVRDMILEFLKAIRPAYGILQKTTPQTLNLGTTPQLIPYTSTSNSDINQTTSSIPNGTVTRSERGTSTINFTMDLECASNRFITFTLFKNGVATPWRITGTGAGSGKPVGVSLTAIDYADPAATYEVRVGADTAGTSTILSNGGLLLSVDPVNSYV